MGIGPSPGRSSPRLLAARTLAALTPNGDRREPDTSIARRVRSLRNQLERGTYRIDPSRLAVSVYEAVVAGGL